MKHAVPIAAVAIVLNATLAVIGRGSFAHIVLVLALIVYVGAPAAIVGSVLYFFRRSRAVRAARVLAILAALCGSTAISAAVGLAVLERDISSAKAFCESAVPHLERYRLDRGQYPVDLRAVTQATPPHLLRNENFYHSDGQRFTFSFSNPGGMMDGFSYDSQGRKWETVD